MMNTTHDTTMDTSTSMVEGKDDSKDKGTKDKGTGESKGEVKEVSYLAAALFGR